MIPENTGKYLVEVKSVDGYTTHSDYDSYRDAVDQADLVGGRVVIAATGATDESAWRHASREQGFDGDFAAWQAQDDAERQEYENGAAGAGN